jgi:hypothetical protein
MSKRSNSQKVVFTIENDDNDREEGSYYSRNKSMFKERYLNQLENKRAYQIDYNLINNEKYTEYQKNYYQNRKEKILENKKERVLCECGKIVSAGHLTSHKKSNIHFKRMNSNNHTTCI